MICSLTDDVRNEATVTRRPSLIGAEKNVPILPDRSGAKISVVAGVKQVRASQLTAACQPVLHSRSIISTFGVFDPKLMLLLVIRVCVENDIAFQTYDRCRV